MSEGVKTMQASGKVTPAFLNVREKFAICCTSPVLFKIYLVFQKGI